MVRALRNSCAAQNSQFSAVRSRDWDDRDHDPERRVGARSFEAARWPTGIRRRAGGANRWRPPALGLSSGQLAAGPGERPCSRPANGGTGHVAAIDRATIAASSPTPNSSEDLRVRRKWTPQKYRPGTTVLLASWVSGNPAGSKAGKRTHRA